MKSKAEIVVRMAPSPTGNLHIGTARATLFNYLFAKKNGGKFILRSEDTDKERSKREYEENIISGLHWLGLEWDEFYRQSERTPIYVSYVKKMIENGTAYLSKEEPKEEGQRSEVVRFKNPNKKITFNDLIRGEVSFDTTELGDFVIAKSPKEPLYHLAVVVDDFEMGVTHVLRGEDHISNTPRQILIQEAIGAPRPIYAHLPLIFDAEHKKLSKRKHGDMVWIDTYKNKGYLPDALLNFFAFMGWNPGTEREIFTLPELVEAFSIERVQKNAAVFNLEKLDWFQREHIKLLPRDKQLEIIAKEFDTKTLPQLDLAKIPWKKSTPTEAKIHLEHILTLIPDAKKIMEYAEAVGKGGALWPLRYALSGKEQSPDPFTLLELLGKDESQRRVKNALQLLG
jgi:glutamyl/glutaminyl-tRNA synthetase